MTANRNWGNISNGAAFEALVSNLVFFEDSAAALFGRRGKDGGQDVRSGDGFTVYQAKHHEDGAASKALADAKKEAGKIKQYREPEHPRSTQWQGVKHWVLVSNVTFNPTDHQKWKDEIEPLFIGQGLTARYWERSNLDALLAKHPEVDRCFFGNNTRVLLTIPEARESLAKSAPFLPRAETIGFKGRQNEIDYMYEFLNSEKRFLVVTGSGGIGKTRLLLEAGAEIAAAGQWQVLWANIASMEAGGHWYDGIVPERLTLLLVDEPSNEQLLRQLSEQMHGGLSRISQWKVAIAVRSPKEPVLRFITGPKFNQRSIRLNLEQLSKDAAEDVYAELLATGPMAGTSDNLRAETARSLARIYGRHPIWMTLAVYLLEERGYLGAAPATAQELASEYFNEIIHFEEDFQPEQVCSVLRWVALLGTLNRQDEQSLMPLIANVGMSKEKVLVCLGRLVQRRALVQRGANNRLVELKPDVLRDYVLRQWLVVDVGFGDRPLQPSESARQLVADILDSVLDDSARLDVRLALHALARTEWMLRVDGVSVSLVAPFFQELCVVAPRLNASSRILVASWMTDIGRIRPSDSVQLCKILRCSPCEPQVVKEHWGFRTTDHGDVKLALAWSMFHVAMGAETRDERRAVLNEWLAILEAEEEVVKLREEQLPNDGKRAAQLLERAIGGGPQFLSNYDDELQEISLRLLNELAVADPKSSSIRAAKVILSLAVKPQREISWAQENEFHVQMYVVTPEHGPGIVRSVVLSRIKDILKPIETSVDVRLLLWTVVGESMRGVRRVVFYNSLSEEMRKAFEEEISLSLNSALEVLSSRESAFKELRAARDLWEWHIKNDLSTVRQAIVGKLESMYQSHALVKEFLPLIGNNRDLDGCLRENRFKAQGLGATGDAESIASFVDRAIEFFGDSETLRVSEIARHLGASARSVPAVQRFVRNSFGKFGDARHGSFAVEVAASWVHNIRKDAASSEALSIVFDLFSEASQELKVLLLGRLYENYSWNEATKEEHSLLRESYQIFLDEKKGVFFLRVVGCTFCYDWRGFRVVVEAVLSKLPIDELSAGVNALIEAVLWRIEDVGLVADSMPNELSDWLLESCLRMPSLGGMSHYVFEQIFKHIPRPTLSWFSRLCSSIAAYTESERELRMPSLLVLQDVSRYVLPICRGDIASDEITSDIETLLDLVVTSALDSWLLGECVFTVDPDGLIVPMAIESRIVHASANDDLRVFQLARIGGFYALNDVSWRVVAMALVRVANALDSSKRDWLFSALLDPRIRAFTSAIGKVPQHLIDKERHTQELLQNEPEAILQSFWQWRLDALRKEIQNEEQHAKEERGE